MKLIMSDLDGEVVRVGGIPPDHLTVLGHDTVLPPTASCVNFNINVPKVPPVNVRVVDDARVISAMFPLLKLTVAVVAETVNICSPPPAVAQLVPL